MVPPRIFPSWNSLSMGADFHKIRRGGQEPKGVQESIKNEVLKTSRSQNVDYSTARLGAHTG